MAGKDHRDDFYAGVNAPIHMHGHEGANLLFYISQIMQLVAHLLLNQQIQYVINKLESKKEKNRSTNYLKNIEKFLPSEQSCRNDTH